MRTLDRVILGYLAIVSSLALWRAPSTPGCWWLLVAHALTVALILLLQRPGLGPFGRVVRGGVHDESAFAMGGVAAHAGLFGTAEDLARFAQMMVNGGVFEHKLQVLRSQAIASSTRSLSGRTVSVVFFGAILKPRRRPSAGVVYRVYP